MTLRTYVFVIVLLLLFRIPVGAVYPVCLNMASKSKELMKCQSISAHTLLGEIQDKRLQGNFCIGIWELNQSLEQN